MTNPVCETHHPWQAGEGCGSIPEAVGTWVPLAGRMHRWDAVGAWEQTDLCLAIRHMMFSSLCFAGQLNRDITYSQLYSFLDCLQVRSLAVAYEPPFPSTHCSSPAPCAWPGEPLQGLDDSQWDPQEFDLRGKSQRSCLAQTLLCLRYKPKISKARCQRTFFSQRRGEDGETSVQILSNASAALGGSLVNGFMNVFAFKPLSQPNSFLKHVISLRKNWVYVL